MLHRAARPAVVLIALSLCTPPLSSRPSASAPSPAAPVSATSAAHVLNRLTYGPRPGDVERVQQMGVAAWIDAQLAPDRLDNAALEARLRNFATLSLDTATLVRDYFEPAQRERLAARRAAGAEPAPMPARPTPSPALKRDRQIIAELEEAKLLRAVLSERQLEEVLVDFWFNHFNVFAGKGPTRAYVTAFERDAIRPHVLGDFRQMLEAVAASPAMLFYLDNWMNTAEGKEPARARRARPQAQARPGAEARRTKPQGQTPPGAGGRRPRGINENYARELLELHTLGVDGGYTQTDIVNVARAFTGWTFTPRQDAAFRFVPALHDGAEKVVLGQTIEAGGGIEDGRRVLDILVAHPSTARFIATKLARKFVSDTPPPALVDRVARRFAETRGNLREVTRAVLVSPEFLAAEAYRAKVKTPLEFVASALRATGTTAETMAPTLRTLREMGMPPYFCQPPTGYDETSGAWVSSGALVARMNFALALAGGRIRGLRPPPQGSGTAADQVVEAVLAGNISPATRATLEKAATPEQRLALVLGSPEFQRQ